MDVDQFTKSLTQQHGPLMQGRELMKCLGFRTQASFARARKRGLLNIHVFDIDGRRGPFALTEDVAEWVAGVASKKPNESRTETAHAEIGGDMT